MSGLHAERLASTKALKRLWSDNAGVFENAFKTNKKLTWWEFIYGSDSAIEISDQIISGTDRYLYRYMPKYLKLSSEDILIYDGKVAIINVEDKISGVVLSNSAYYYNSKELFDFNWRTLPEVTL